MFKRSSEVVRVKNPKNFDSFTLPSSSNAASLSSAWYSCELCSKQWNSETEVHYHKRSHFHRMQKDIIQHTYFCWTCIRPFQSNEDLLTHVKLCHLLSSLHAQRVEREIFVCDYCDNIFFNKEMLTLHIKIRHRNFKSKKQFYECGPCNRLVNIKNAWHHVHLHGMVGLRICAICFKRFLNWKDLRRHLNITHQLYLHCDICNIRSISLDDFTHHIEKHNNISTIQSAHENDTENEQASVDKYFVPHNWNIRKAQYRNLLPYQGLRLHGYITICILCREICTTYKERKQHILQHNAAETPDFKEKPSVEKFLEEYERKDVLPKIACSCGETFLYKILLKQHLLKNKASEFKHEELNERDIAELISVQDDSTIVIEIVDNS